MTMGKKTRKISQRNDEDMQSTELTTPSGNSSVSKSQEKCNPAKHNLAATSSPDPVEAKELRNISERAGPTKMRKRSRMAKHDSPSTSSQELVEEKGAGPTKMQKRSKMAKHDSPSASSPELVEEKGLYPAKEKRKTKCMSSNHTLPSSNGPMAVAEKDLNNILQETREVHDSKKHRRLQLSVDKNSSTFLETENTTEVIKESEKHITPEGYDATHKLVEKGSLCNPDQTNFGSLEQDKTCSLLQVTEIDPARKLHHEEAVDGNLAHLEAWIGGNLASPVETKHNVLLENMDTDSMENSVPLDKHPFNEKLVTSSLQAREREDTQIEKKNSLPSENGMKTMDDNDLTASLQVVQDSPVDGASIQCLNNKYASKKKIKKKAEGTVLEDKSRRDSLITDLHQGLVEKSVDELTTILKEVKKRNACKKEKMEVSPTDFKEAAPSLPSGYAANDVTSSDLDGSGTSLQVVDADVMAAAGCGDKELASTREHIIKKNNGEVFGNLAKVTLDCDLVEANLESCSTDCQKEAKIVIENGASEKDKLLDLSLPPDKAPVICTRRKLLILDLNGLLVDMINFESSWRRPDTRIGGRLVYKRPFCDDFLKFCFERFSVGIWSSRTRRNMEAVVDFLMRDDKCKTLFFWVSNIKHEDQTHCTETGFTTVENRSKPLFLKELKKIWDKEVPTLPWEKGDYTPSNTLLLDDSPYKALRNPPYTAIFPRPYRYRDIDDNSLGPGGDLRVYLEGLAKCDDVPCYVQEHPFGQRAITSSNPSWLYYLKVIGVENSPSPAL